MVPKRQGCAVAPWTRLGAVLSVECGHDFCFLHEFHFDLFFSTRSQKFDITYPQRSKRTEGKIFDTNVA